MAKNKLLLEVNNVHVSYGAVKALRGVSIKVQEGEIVALLGANGSGKSTLLESVLGLHSVESGVIRFNGKAITNKNTDAIVASGICLLPEGRGILSLMTVMENLQLGAYHVQEDFQDNVQRVFGRFERLEQRRKQLSGTLSGGEQQMLSLARALMSAPKLLMMDEPSLGLAPVLVEEVFSIIKELNKSGYAILLSEQNARKAVQCAHRGYVFRTGEVVDSGTAQELDNHLRMRDAYLGGLAEY